MQLYCIISSYNQSFDLEGESGIVVRGIGTCVLLLPSQQSPTTQVYMYMCMYLNMFFFVHVFSPAY